VLQIFDSPLPQEADDVLVELQALVDGQAGYPARVDKAVELWDKKMGQAKRKRAFLLVRTELSKISYGVSRCAYCEDSGADEIEHLFPKSLFPELAFKWSNYAFACGPCNGPKGNRFAVIKPDGAIDEFVRKRGDPVIAPRAGTSGLVNPRAEDPMTVLELDLGGRAIDGTDLPATFLFEPKFGLDAVQEARAKFTIDVLGLNRELVRRSRRAAFRSFRSQLLEYTDMKGSGATNEELDEFRLGMLEMPHLTVFEEMRSQREFLPQIDDCMNRAPEIAEWKITPGGGFLNIV